jgi:hypothetical protein
MLRPARAPQSKPSISTATASLYSLHDNSVAAETVDTESHTFATADGRSAGFLSSTAVEPKRASSNASTARR